MYVFGGLSTSFFSATIAEKLDNETYLAYVKHLLKLHGKIILVVDGVRYHFEKEHVQEFYKENGSRLKII